jgi:hypothetical protein
MTICAEPTIYHYANYTALYYVLTAPLPIESNAAILKLANKACHIFTDTSKISVSDDHCYHDNYARRSLNVGV